MTAPIGTRIEKVSPAVRNAVIDLRLIGIRLSIGLRDTLRDNLRVALLVTREFTVGTLHTSRVLEEVAAKRASHDVVKLLLDKLVAILFVNFVFLLTNGTFTTKSKIVIAFFLVLLHEAHGHVDSPNGFERKPRLDKYWSSLRHRRTTSSSAWSTA